MRTAHLFMRHRAQFNSSDKGAGITLSNANLTAAATSGNTVRASAFYKTSGKWYWEVKVNSGTTLGVMGIASNGAINLSSYLGSDAYGWGIYATASLNKIHSAAANGTDVPARSGYLVPNGVIPAAGDTMMFALDMTNGYIYIGRNGTWYNGLSSNAIAPDPTSGATGQGAIYGSLSGSICPAFGANSTYNITANFGQNPFLYTPPAGYNPGFYL